MKTRIYSYFAAGLLALTAVGCTDLDVDVKSKYTEYPTSDVALEGKMADVYYAFRGALGRRYNESQTLSTEDVGVSFDGDWVDSRTYAHMSLHDFSPDDASCDWYPDLASGITKCNQVIVDLGGDEADPANIAPARAMRAFYHFILMDSYGDIPILDKIPDDSAQIERSSRPEVAEWIESELLDIIPYLSTSNDASTYGKPNKWMAEALLVKLYLNWAVYTQSDVTQYDPSLTNEKLNDCVKYCDDIIQSGLFSLDGGVSSWRAKFYPDNGYQVKDFIYAMPYDAVTAQGNTYGRFRTWRKANGGTNQSGTTMSYYGEPSVKSFGGNFAMAPEFAELFSLEGDQRNEAVLGGDIYILNASTHEKTSERWLYSGNEVSFTKTITLKTEDADLNVGNDVNGWSQGWKSIKFIPANADYVACNGRNQSNDIPIFRYADILLTKAECILRGATATNGDTPVSLMNQIRSYAGAPTVTSVDLDELLKERGREFFDENWTRNDWIRFGVWENEFGVHRKDFPTANFEKTRRIFPIPTTVMKENVNWSQNPGY
jgi:hypothetical protein